MPCLSNPSALDIKSFRLDVHRPARTKFFPLSWIERRQVAKWWAA